VIVGRVNTFQPAYYRLEKEGLFAERLEQARLDIEETSSAILSRLRG